MSNQLNRAFQGFKQQYPYANVSDFYGGLVINNIQQQIANIQRDINNFAIGKIVDIKNVYTKNFLLEELKTSKIIKSTVVLQGLNDNLEQRTIKTTYQCRIDLVINVDDPFQSEGEFSGNTLYRLWTPFLTKIYNLSSDTSPNWLQAKNNKVIRLNNQNLLYFGDLKGVWTTDETYVVGDLVYVQSNYASFMEMPVNQKQTFVFICTKTHYSDFYTYQDFFRTDDDYTDSGNHIFPRVQSSDENFPWNVVRMENNTCRQWWFWNNETNSVNATLYTTAMLSLYYPIHYDSNDPFLLDVNQGGTGYASPAHTLRQNNGIIVNIGGVLTLWTSNWWKTQTVTTNDISITFPTIEGENFVEDGVEDGKFLWVKNETVSSGSDIKDYFSNPIVKLPINIDIQPYASIYISRISNVANNFVKACGLSADATQNENLGDGNETQFSNESMTFTFDHNQCCWYRENT